MGLPWVRDPLRRRATLAVLAVIAAIFSVWPREYLAKADLIPDDSGGGLSSLLSSAGGGGLLSLGALLGNHQSIEADLTIARSEIVIDDLLKALPEAQRARLGKGPMAAVRLRKQTDLESIRGSILEITVKDRDPALAKALTQGFVTAIRGRLTTLNLEQAAEKKAVAQNRLAQATSDVARTQAALNSFRAANHLAAPEIQLGSAVAVQAALQGRLEAEEVQLQTLRKFATGNNVEVQAEQAQIAGLRGRIQQAQTAGGGGAPTLGSLTPVISDYENLYIAEKYAEAAFEIYKRYLDTVTVEELSATTNLDVIQPPYVDPARQYNVGAVGMLILIVLSAVAAEFYIARPPPGRP